MRRSWALLFSIRRLPNFIFEFTGVGLVYGSIIRRRFIIAEMRAHVFLIFIVRRDTRNDVWLIFWRFLHCSERCYRPPTAEKRRQRGSDQSGRLSKWPTPLLSKEGSWSFAPIWNCIVKCWTSGVNCRNLYRFLLSKPRTSPVQFACSTRTDPRGKQSGSASVQLSSVWWKSG